VGQFIGALSGAAIIEKINDRRSMMVGAFCTLPMLFILIAPSTKSDMDAADLEDNSFWVSKGFVYGGIVLASIVNGLG